MASALTFVENGRVAFKAASAVSRCWKTSNVQRSCERSSPWGLGEDGSPAEGEGRDSGTLARFTTAVSARCADRPQHQLQGSPYMTRDDQTQLQAIAQQEYLAIREKVPSKIAALASPKLVVLPDRFMRKHGGAGAIYFWLCVSPSLLQAPKEVRQAVIAHEWGHMALGHTNATIGALVGALLYILITLATPPGLFWPAVNIVILGMIFLGLYWALHQKREFEADDKGADAVGARTMAHALRWITDAMREGEQSELVQARLQQLEERALREETAAQAWRPLKAWPVDFAGFTTSAQIEARIKEIEPRVRRGHEDLCWATWELEQLRVLQWELEAGSSEGHTEGRRA